jgi:hypothetical protein
MPNVPYSAASCSVPLVFSPAPLLSKDPKTGAHVTWNPDTQNWIDGSVDNDLPMTRLAEMFNVNHFIVSQVNPHVVPVLVREEFINSDSAPDESSEASSSWLKTLAGFAKSEALHRMGVLSELGVFPNYFTKLRSVLSQKYSGDITILPEVSYAQFPKVLKNPTTDFMLKAMICGEKATWPQLSRIQNHCAIELALDEAVQRLRTKIAFSPSQVDLRMISLGGMNSANSSHGGRSQKNGGKSRNKMMGRQARAAKTKSWVGDDKATDRQRIRMSEPLGATGFARPSHTDTATSLSGTANVEHDSGSESDDEEDEENQESSDEEAGLTFMRPLRKPFFSRWNSHHGRNKSFPTPGTRQAPEQNTDDGDGDPNMTTTTAYDSSFSNPRSYSPSSDARSPPPERETGIGNSMARSTPSLWPIGTRSFIAMHSMPSTPGIGGSFTRQPEEMDEDETDTEMGQPWDKDDMEESKEGFVPDISGTRGMMLRRKKSLGG